MAGALLLGGTFIGTPTIVTALLRHAVPAPRYATTFGLATALFAVGQMLGPLLGGIVVESWGLVPGTAAAAALLAGAALSAASFGVVRRQVVA